MCSSLTWYHLTLWPCASLSVVNTDKKLKKIKSSQKLFKWQPPCKISSSKNGEESNWGKNNTTKMWFMCFSHLQK